MCQWSNSSHWCFLNASGSEGFVDASTESYIVEKLFRIVSFILASKSLVFIICQFEIQHAKYAAKLSLSNVTFSKFVIVIEELFYSNSFHDND